MAYRGFFALNDYEFANSSRVVSHLNVETPLSDVGLIRPIGRSLKEDPIGSGLYIPASDEIGYTKSGAFPIEFAFPWASDVDNVKFLSLGSGLYDVQPWDFNIVETPPDSGLYTTGECGLVEHSNLLYEIPSTSQLATGHRGLYTIPDGGVLYSSGLIQVEDGCWSKTKACTGCRPRISYDDSWPGLAEFRQDGVYRIQTSPWHSVERPESEEFLGVWMMDATGLGPITVQRNLTELIGPGSVPDRNHDASRTITFDALLLACTNSGLEYGMEWLTCQLRQAAVSDDSVLQFLSSHPSHSSADPEELVREVRNVVLTKSPEIRESVGAGPGPNQQATMYRVSWEMTATNPYVYLPPITFPANWDDIYTQTISWVHGVGCIKPAGCDDFPTLFSKTCIPEVINLPSQPPPVCGGCMPLSTIETRVYNVPTVSYPRHCNETAVNVIVKNLSGRAPLTMQSYWQRCATNPLCEDHRFPLQISGLPANFDLMLSAVDGRFWAEGYTHPGTKPLVKNNVRPSGAYQRKRWRPVGIVGTPSGAPWQPVVINREDCWQLVVVTPPGSNFSVYLELTDRGA